MYEGVLKYFNRMKYLILLMVVSLVMFLKPWELSFTEHAAPSTQDTLLLASNTLNPTLLLPVNQVINNGDSDLPETRRFDRMVEQFIKKWEIKGASFALMKEDKLVYCKGYGLADEKAQIPVDVNHIFRVASVSKLITAVGIMKLYEKGQLRLDAPVFGKQGILNDSCYRNYKDKRFEQITVEHLLRHQGGFSTVYGDPMFCPLDIARKMNLTPPIDLQTTIQFVLSRRLHFNPGSACSYSNVGYGILSKVIEKISGMDYETYIRKSVLLPAGCSDMYLGHNDSDMRLPNEVQYYEVSNAERIPACDGSGRMVYRSNGGNNIEELHGAGGWVASPAELLRFLAAIDGEAGIPDILKPATITYMTQEVPNAFPIGWIDTTPDGEWTRTGTLAGTSALLKKQKDGYSWIFVTNTSSWKGSRFPAYVASFMKKAFSTVSGWPERNLFELQQFDHEKLLVER